MNTVSGLPDFFLAYVITTYLLDDDNSLPFLTDFGLVSRNAYMLSQSIISTAKGKLKKRIVLFVRKLILMDINKQMMKNCAGHFTMDNMMNIKAHPYFTLRWLVYDPLPSLRFYKERRFMINMFALQYPDNAFWSSAGWRVRMRKIETHSCTPRLFEYLRHQVFRRTETISKVFSAWYAADFFESVIESIFVPFCAFCLKQEHAVNNTHMFCTVCNKVDPTTNFLFHSGYSNPTSVSTLVPICKNCVELDLVDPTHEINWHCMYGNIVCCKSSHTSHSCSCPCHGTSNPLALEYVGFKSKMKSLGASFPVSSPYDYAYPATDASDDE